ncbi:MAG: pilus assembly protein TadG-related protein [Hyphomicrobiaceae bacterium]|nr:pilus assembly protein TadG-related protein [Hyphomicrobiaceae bacterium]
MSLFRDDKSGAIAPIFAGLISFLVLVTATALEVGRWAIARNELQASMDAAVLAGAAKLQLNQADKAAAVETAKKAFKANRSRQRFGADIIENVSFSVEGNSLYAKGSADLVTVLAKVVGMDTLPLLGTSEATGESETGSVATITNSKFELSLMLDITGSMCDSAPDLDDSPCTKGVKLDAMKTAASNLVKSMLATEELKTRVRVALVPFSDGVRLPALPRLAAAGLTPAVQTFSENYQSCSGWTCQTKTRNYYYHPTECVVERMGTEKYTDAAPGPGNYVMNFMRQGKSLVDATPQEFGCTLGTSSVIMPLTSNKDAILTTIAGLSAKGGTAGQLGTAWAWYTLSPNWKNVWAGSSDDPAPYPAANDKTLRKIAILMTDGDYNNEFSAGGYRVGSWAYTNIGKSVVNASSTAQAQALCTGMKAKGIEVYTVGYEVSSAAKTFLKTCASDDAHAFSAESATELAAVFQGIGQRVLSLYLSQ